MKTKKILFTEVHKAELREVEIGEVKEGDVLVEMEYTVISGGTERACILGMQNTTQTFPTSLGYCGIGHVLKVGDKVTRVSVGDRVLVYHGNHAKYNIRPEEKITKVEDDAIPSLDASFTIIASMGLGGVRKLEIELGESAMVMGLGLLGQYAVKLLRCAGATPIIAVDPIESKRNTALTSGADYALNPFEEGFADRVKEITGGGVNVCIEVTGQGAGLDMALDCMAMFGRVALLGCTRNKDFSIDYYRKVHCPGISLIGAHTRARPEHDSRPGYFTHRDDIAAVFRLLKGGRLSFESLGAQLHSPHECPEVYEKLINDKNFPAVVQFDWERL